MKRCNAVYCLIVRVFSFLVLANLLSNGAYARDDGDSYLDDLEMAIDMSGDDAAWQSLDDGLKKRFVEEYRNSGPDDAAFFDRYMDLIPARAMLDFLDMEYPACHSESHELGRAIFRKLNDVNAALRVCGNRCTNGCMHGVIGEAFSSDPDQEMKDTHAEHRPDDGSRRGSHTHQSVVSDKLIEEMEAFCLQGEMARLHKRGNCAHAMGHALMLKTDHGIEASIDGCNRFAEAGMDYYCASGVYMQYMDNSVANGSRKTDIQRWGFNYPCNIHMTYPAACYRYVIREIRKERALGLEHMVYLCAQLPAGTRSGCFHGLGNAYAPAIGKFPGLLKVVCSYGGTGEQFLCIEGAIEKLADYREEWAMAACATLDGDNGDICHAAALGKMYRLDKPTMDMYRNNPAITPDTDGPS